MASASSTICNISANSFCRCGVALSCSWAISEAVRENPVKYSAKWSSSSANLLGAARMRFTSIASLV